MVMVLVALLRQVLMVVVVQVHMVVALEIMVKQIKEVAVLVELTVVQLLLVLGVLGDLVL